MKKKSFLLMALVLIVGQFALAATGYELMITAVYYSQQSNGQSWLALEKKGDGYELINFKGSGYPIVLLRNPAVLKPGLIKGAEWKNDQLIPGKSIKVSFEGKEYRFVVSAKDSGKKGCKRYTAYKLEVESGGLKQTLFSTETYSDVLPWLAWSGDLDKDGKADFLIEYPDDCNVSQTRVLYLSSIKNEKEFVGEGAKGVARG